MTQNSINKKSSVITIDNLQLNSNVFSSLTGNFILQTSNADQIQVSNGTNTILNMSPTGEFTTPLQPAFLAYLISPSIGVTGNGTEVVVNFDTESFDIGNNFTSSNLFTAPVTGKYILGTNVTFTNLSSAMTACRLSIVTSNNTFEVFGNAYALSQSGVFGSLSLSFTCDMDVSDTAQVYFRISNGAGDTADINGGGDLETYFYGKLLS